MKTVLSESDLIDRIRYGGTVILAARGLGKSDMCYNGGELGYTLIDCSIFAGMSEGRWVINPAHLERLGRAGVSCVLNADNAADLITWHYGVVLVDLPLQSDRTQPDLPPETRSDHARLVAALDSRDSYSYCTADPSTMPRVFKKRG